MSKRRGSPILTPCWTRPAIVRAGDALRMVLEARGAPDGRPTATVRQGAETWPLALAEGESPAPGLTAWAACLADGVPPGLYELRVAIGGRDHAQRGAVCVLPEEIEDLTLAHCSDLHLLKPTAEGMEDRTSHVLTMIERLNETRPDLVICTGDLISRYDPDKRPLPAKTIRWQIRWLAQYLPALEAPLYVTTGNHDVAFWSTRADWYAAMGGGLEGRTGDWSVDWGPLHLSFMDCFAYYDGQNTLLESSFRPAQLAWLRTDMAATDPDATRLLFAHYDYRHQLPAVFPVLGLDAFFYGHSVALYPEELERHAIWDGHLPAGLAYRVVHCVGKVITVLESVPWRALT